MSGTPKYSWAQLRREQQAKLEAERQRKAEEEARRRAEAAEKERRRRLENLRSQVSSQVRTTELTLKQRASAVPRDEVSELIVELTRLSRGARSAQTEGDLNQVQQALLAVEQKIERRAAAEAARRAEVLRRRTEAERALSDLHAVIAGLKADPIVMRWQYHRMSELEALAEHAKVALEAEQWEVPAAHLAKVQSSAETLLKAASAAQLKAETRDYIANSIAMTLEQMGYVVSTPKPVHLDHPASDLEFRAVDAVGRAVGVSVPVEGQVYYSVDGFSHTSEPLADGSIAPACDQAEAVLNKMREHLAQACGVETGEVLWEGKADPDRRLRKADELPRSDNRSQGR